MVAKKKAKKGSNVKKANAERKSAPVVAAHEEASEPKKVRAPKKPRHMVPLYLGMCGRLESRFTKIERSFQSWPEGFAEAAGTIVSALYALSTRLETLPADFLAPRATRSGRAPVSAGDHVQLGKRAANAYPGLLEPGQVYEVHAVNGSLLTFNLAGATVILPRTSFMRAGETEEDEDGDDEETEESDYAEEATGT